MSLTLAFGMSFLILAHLTILIMAIVPFFEDVLKFPIAAWYPFSTENPKVFFIMYVYQIYGISMSACVNTSTDTLASGMIAHADSQVRRLGIMLSRIGYENPKEMLTQVDEEMKIINQDIKKIENLKCENYGQVAKCVIFHHHILQ